MSILTATLTDYVFTKYVNNHIFALYVLFVFQFSKGIQSTSDDVENHLELGRKLLALRNYNDALTHYHAAIRGDPTNYFTYFTRATIYLALGKSKSALEDLEEVIKLKPDFLPARNHRSNVLFKQGDIDEAHKELSIILNSDPNNIEAFHLYSLIDTIKEDLMKVQMAVEDSDYHHAIDIINKLLQELPWDVKLHKMRAFCHEELWDIDTAINDLRTVTKLSTDDTEAYLKMSYLHYKIGQAEESLTAIRGCLKSDPDHKECWKQYKKTKKIASLLKAMNEHVESVNYNQCVEKADLALKEEPAVPKMIHRIKAKKCSCLLKDQKPIDAIKVCTEALNIDPNDSDVLCNRANAHMINDDLSSALSDFNSAKEINPFAKCAEEGLQEIKNREKSKRNRNYYKILGVTRDASKREIIKAYRKLAHKWHPDNFQGEEKKKAEAMFIDIAAAKEVLTDPEKRSKYDKGEDPLNPESQKTDPFTYFHNFDGAGQTFYFRTYS